MGKEGTKKKLMRRVSIIVLNWNGKDVTSECLDSLMKVNYDDFEVIVVDNGSEDGSQEHLKKHYGWATLIENETNLGYAAGNNVGIKYALEKGSEYLLLLNNDTVVDSDFLYKLVLAGESDEKVGILNPKIYYYDNPKVIWYAGGKFTILGGISVHIGRKKIDKGQYDQEKEVTFITGCAFLIKRHVIDDIGILDENYYMYAEDADWSLRAIKAGYKALYVPASVIWHKVGIDRKVKKGEEFRLYFATRNHLYLTYKNFTPQHFLLFQFYFLFRWLLYMSLKMLLSGNYKATFSIYKGWLDFWPMIRESQQYTTDMRTTKYPSDSTGKI